VAKPEVRLLFRPLRFGVRGLVFGPRSVAIWNMTLREFAYLSLFALPFVGLAALWV
jgi:hypothetical protein